MTLSATRAKALKDPGRYSDGGGLHLYVSKAGGKSWVQRITIDGRRRDIGLGGFPSVSLALAREKAAENRAAVAEGRDPLADTRKDERYWRMVSQYGEVLYREDLPMLPSSAIPGPQPLCAAKLQPNTSVETESTASGDARNRTQIRIPRP